MNLNELSDLIGGKERCHNCRAFRTAMTITPETDLTAVSGICLRDPVRQEVREVEVPILDAQGKARTLRDGKVMTMTQRQANFGYPPMHALLWCMSWRPKDQATELECAAVRYSDVSEP